MLHCGAFCASPYLLVVQSTRLQVLCAHSYALWIVYRCRDFHSSSIAPALYLLTYLCVSLVVQHACLHALLVFHGSRLPLRFACAPTTPPRPLPSFPIHGTYIWTGAACLPRAYWDWATAPAWCRRLLYLLFSPPPPTAFGKTSSHCLPTILFHMVQPSMPSMPPPGPVYACPALPLTWFIRLADLLPSHTCTAQQLPTAAHWYHHLPVVNGTSTVHLLSRVHGVHFAFPDWLRVYWFTRVGST